MNKFLSVSASLLALILSCDVDASDDFEFSGFARLVAGQYLQDDNSLRGYDDSISFDNDSLVALRGDCALSQSISLVGQAIYHSNEFRDSGIQWLYADYRPSRYISVKFGRQRIPFFQYSDVIDVGFAYHWITPPISVYTNYLFTEFDGLLGRYNFSNSRFNAYAEAYYGQFDGNITLFSEDIYADVDNIAGVLINVSSNKFSLRLSHHIGDTKVEQAELSAFSQTLSQLGFIESANTLLINDPVSISQLGLAYEDIDYFLRGEYTITRSDAFLIAVRKSGYLSAGINAYPFTFHGTVSYGTSSVGQAPSEIPIGLSPELDQLAIGYGFVLGQVPPDEGYQYTLGLRYDMRTNLAIKAELTHIEGEQGTRGFFDQVPRNNEEQSGQLLQFAVEWVF
ncbi:hypothetical protein PN836_020605 [Ningiella sp. W23]|uniref:hypothetical protein n=1 Tax=Ningiella sp. W23 TaxID=3023715 RepID=UPI003757E25E